MRNGEATDHGHVRGPSQEEVKEERGTYQEDNKGRKMESSKPSSARLGKANRRQQEPVEAGDVLPGTIIWIHHDTTPIPYLQLLGHLFTLSHERRSELMGETGKSIEHSASVVFTRRKQEANLCQSIRHCETAETFRRAHHTVPLCGNKYKRFKRWFSKIGHQESVTIEAN